VRGTWQRHRTLQMWWVARNQMWRSAPRWWRECGA